MRKLIKENSCVNASIVGLRVDPDDAAPTFFFFLIGKAQDPLLVDSQIVLFTRLDSAVRAAAVAGFQTEADDSSIILDLVVDVSSLLHMLEDQDEAADSLYLNTLNTLFDLVTVTGATIPDSYQKPLYDLADHLTFHRSLNCFLEQKQIPRNVLIDGVLWLLGWVFSHSKYLMT